MRPRSTAAVGAAALLVALPAVALPAAAGAHITIQPDELAAGSYVVVDVRVPNERHDRGTTKVALQLPPGVSHAAYQPVPNWTVAVTKRRPVTPFSAGGEPVSEEVDTITWTGRGRAGVIAPGEFLQLPVSLRVPDGAEGTVLSLEALQTYEGGEVVRWIGTADADLPAPTITLEEPEDERSGAHGGEAPGGSGSSTSAETDDDAGNEDDAEDAGGDAAGDDDGGNALPIALGAAGLLAGLAGLGLAVAGRRRSS